MPVMIVDTEQAALIKAALQMFEAALTARVERADPEKIISNSLSLQAKKLKTVRDLLDMPDPPPFSQLSKHMRQMADNQLWLLHTRADDAAKDAAWQRLREIFIAPAFPPAPGP